MSEPAAAASLESPLRVALLGYRSNPYSGGQGIYLRYLSRALGDAGHRVDVISGEPYPELDAPARLVKLPGLNLFAAANHVTALRPRHLRSATDTFEWWSMLTGGFPEPYTFGRRVEAHFRRRASEARDYQVVHDNQCLSYGTLALQQRGIPLLTTIHHPITWDRDIALAHAAGWRERLLIRRWHNFLRMQCKVARRLKHIVTVSESSKRDICAAFNIDPARVHVIYNGIDTDTFRPEPDIERDPWQIITTASADQPLKGTQYLIPAFATLCQQFPRLRLVFVGKPKPGGATEQLIRRLGVGDRISFRHGVSADEFRALYARSAVAVVPSEYEGFGFPAGEAMACATPVVSTDGGALPEVVGNAGRTVPVRNPAALAQAIGELLNDPDARDSLGRRGRQRILDNFCWSRTAAALTELYHFVLADAAR
ncbi:MAG: glycosyltransferase family 4 protein [Gammaproteobacteria bacterium]|nr:glycosyltransferase family 4 protein [Gammaproteobacteria bacterium]